MSWFEEQISTRKQADEEALEEYFTTVAGAVMGRKMSQALNDDRQRTTDAIGELLRFYHVKPQEVPDNIKDMNEILEFLMRPHGIMRRAVHLDRHWYRDAIGAMLGRRKDDGAVVALVPYGISGYRYYDDRTDKYVRINSRNENLFDDEAFAFYKPFPVRKMGMGSLIRYIIEQISVSDIVMLILSMIVVTAVGMLIPRLNSLLFSDVLESGSIRLLIGIGIYMACTSVSLILFGTVRTMINGRINTKLDLSIEAASMMRILSLPAEFFKDYSAGELSNRICYIGTLAARLTDMVLTTGLSSLFSLAYLSQVFKYAPSLVVPSIIVTLLSLIITVVSVLLQTGISRRQMLLSSKESGISYAMISGIQKIRLSGSEKRAYARWGKAYADAARLMYNPPLFLKVSPAISTAVTLLGTLWIYSAAIRSSVSVSDYYAFNSAYGVLSAAFLALSGVAVSASQIRPILEMAKPIFETVPEISEEKAMVTKLSGGIELNNVTFRYSEDMPAVLDNLSLKITPGQYVAIVGKTGCGKSTLVRILLGLETPQKGAVYYDGRDIKKLDLKSLRRRIGTVMQNGKLFMGDIFSNITICAPWLTLDEAWEAAEVSGLAEDIRNMPMGMNTIISEGQGGISGGQRQRLLIARAIAPKPKILMFDEATSALDNLTQKQVSNALDGMKCTRIVIAHRLSTIRQCDRIIVLEGGHIVEDGSYDELIAMNGYFAELVSRQRLDDEGFVARTTAF